MGDVSEVDLAYLLAKSKGEITEEEFKGVRSALASSVDRLAKTAFRDGFQAPPFIELWHREIVQYYGDTQWQDAKNRRAAALARDVTPLIHKQIEERRRYGGNVVLEFAGPTGFGKSSSMLGLMERHNRLADIVNTGGVDALRRHISIDLQELPGKLEHLQAGDAIAMDEQLHLVGEGSETAVKTLRNLEDTLRGTQIDLHFASPGKRDNHDASQGYLEAVSMSPIKLRDGARGRLATRFLYFLGLGGYDPIPLGYVDMPWCTPKVFDAYSIIKKENLDRTRRAQFTNATANNVDVIKRVFDHPAFQARLRHNLRPTKTDMRRYVRQYAGTSLSMAETDAIASEMEEMLNVLRDDDEEFTQIWSFPPTPAMKKLAGRGEDDTGIRSMDP